MAALIITPSIVRRVEDNLRVITVSAWARRQKNLWWRRVMKTRSSSTKKEIIQWMLETAQILPMGNGGRYAIDDLVEIAHEIENEDFGAAMKLTSDEISDALESPMASGNALDRAANWGRHIGNSGSYWPQKQCAYLLKNGKTLKCYDGGAFFRAHHPVNPYTGGGGAFLNLFTGYPFSAQTLALISAYIENIPGPDGHPRHLVPRIVAGGTDLKFDINQVLNAEWYTDPNNSDASGSNVIKMAYDFEPPVIAPELNEPGVWYLFCELVEDDELAGLIYQERAPFTMNSYAPMSDAELGRLDEFEWQFKGRNAVAYGHPFLAFRVEPGGTPNIP